MLHKPKISTLKHLHSIPRYFMHSIPIMSLVALLTLTLFTINPSPHSNIEAYAIEDTNVRDTISTSNSSNSDLDTVEREDSTVSKADEDTEAEVMPLAAPSATASLQITSGSLTETTEATPGKGPAYRNHNITYTATNTTNYTLRVSYASGQSSLQYYGASGSNPTTGGTTITGAGGKTGATMNNNTWGFGWSDSTSTSNDSMTYYTMPTSTNGTGLAGGVIKSGTAVNSSTGKLSFAAKFADNAIAGHYKTQVLLSLLAMPDTVTYKITYDCKSGSGCPANVNEEGLSSGYPYTIPTTRPTRANYTFLGYSTSSTATTANANYAPGNTITLTSASPNLALYAVWKEDVTWSNITTMQQMTCGICASASNMASKTLTDSRDGASYTVTKLNDGKCWMTSSLRIVNKTLTPNDSNVTSNYTVPASSSSGWRNDNHIESQNVLYMDTHVGAYYTWCAATAGCHEGQSICPKGWRLPTKAEYENLASKDEGWNSSSKGRTLAGGFFPAFGYVWNGSANYINSQGNYWSGTSGPYSLGFTSENVSVSINGTNTGNSVRCIAQ